MILVPPGWSEAQAAANRVIGGGRCRGEEPSVAWALLSRWLCCCSLHLIRLDVKESLRRGLSAVVSFRAGFWVRLNEAVTCSVVELVM